MARPMRRSTVPRRRVARPALDGLESRIAPASNLSVNDAMVLEGNAGTTGMNFTVTLSSVSATTVTVDYATADGTATVAGGDYQQTGGTLSFAPGQTSRTVTVPVVGDTVDEHNETFTLVLSNPSNATIVRGTGTGTILDDDPTPVTRALTASASGIVRDYTGTGVFTELASAASELTVRTFDSAQGPTVPRDERSVLEFAVGAIAASDATGASLTLNCLYTTLPQTTEVDVYGFADSDGVTLSDATQPAVLLGKFSPTTLGTFTVPLDLSAVFSLLQQGTSNIGIRLSGVPNDNVAFSPAGDANQPTLNFQVVPSQVSVSDATANEGSPANFTVTLSEPLTAPATIHYTTIASATGPNATPNVDYIPVQGTLTFAPGETSRTISIPTVTDAVVDPGEKFGLQLYNLAPPLVGSRSTATATIADQPAATPGIRVSDVSVTEGDSGHTSAAFTLSLSVATADPVTVNIATADGTATAASHDYVPFSGTVTFAPGQTSMTVPISVIGDTTHEGDETFQLNLSNPTNAVLLVSTGTATILNDDPQPTASISDASVVEGNSGTTSEAFTVTLSNPSDATTSFLWSTADGTAQAGLDYQGISNRLLTFNPGQTVKVIVVVVLGDTFTEGDETFSVTLSSPTGGATIGRATGTGTIVDDDPTTGTMSFTAGSWGTAEDSNGDGTFDTYLPQSSDGIVKRFSAVVQDRALFEFDVSKVIAGLVSSVTFDFSTSSYVTPVSGPVLIGGFAGNGTPGLADATRTVVPLGSYSPDSVGRRSVVLDRAAVLAITGGSNILGLRLDASSNLSNTSIQTASLGLSVAPTLTFHADLPVAFADAYSLNEDATLTIPAAGVLANDYHVAGSTLTATMGQTPAHGSLALAADGSFTYTPAPLYHGTDSFTYTASDGTNTTGVVTVSLTINPVNHPPQATGDSYSVAEGSTLTVAAPGVLANDTDVDGDPLTVAVVAGPSHGTLALAADGSFVYTPAALYRGSDSFTYQASDGQARSGVVTVSLTVTPVNHAPVASDDRYSLLENSVLTIAAPGVLGNDNDPDGDPLSAAVASGPSHGTLTLHQDGSLTYTPAQDFFGTDSFTYQVNDGALTSGPATVNLTVGRVDKPPVTTDQSVVAIENQAVSATLTGTDPDGDTLSFTVVAGPSHGSLSGTAPNLTYTPNAGYHGPDSFTFKASDGTLDSNTATVTIRVDAPPTADGLTLTTAENTAAPVTLSASDPEGDALSYAILTNPAHGSLSGAAPNLTYTPNAGYFGADSFTFQVNDGVTSSNIATVALVVDAPPTATASTVHTLENVAAPVVLSASDPEGGALSYAILTNPAHGSLSGTAPNLTYTPNAGYFGADSFTFKTNDGTLDSNTATVSIDVAIPTTSTVVTASTTTPTYGGAVTFTATVTAAAPSTGTPTGTVQFVVDGSNVGAPVTLVNGVATFAPSAAIPAGPHSVTAVYVNSDHGFVGGQGTLANGLTVGKALLIIKADPLSRTYGSSNPTLTVGYSGFVAGDSPSSLSAPVTVATSAVVSSHVGVYPITPSGATSANYAIQFVAGTLNVTPAPLTVSAGNATKLYGAPLPALTVGYSGFVAGDGPSVLQGAPTFATTATTASHVGNYSVTPGGLAATDYAITFAPGTLAVTPAPLTIVADSKTKLFGAALPVLTASYSGFVNGDSPGSLTTPVVLTTSAYAGSPVGTYGITASGASGPDYAVSFVPGTLTVTPPVAGDYNGDGRTDLALFFRPPSSSTGVWYVPNVTSPAGLPFGSSSLDIPVQGDFNGDGKTDFAVYRPRTAQWFVGGLPTIRFGQANVSIPVPGNYDGLGLTQVAVYQPNTGQWFIGGRSQPATLGIAPKAGDIPVPADYDGTGKTELAIYRPSTHQWFIQGHAQPITYGGPNDVPVPADYDGLGRAELALFRPATQQWFVGGHAQPVRFGGPGDVPVPGDYDGVGHTQYVLYRPTTGQWFIGGHADAITYGGPHLIPAAAPYPYRALSGNLRIKAAVTASSSHFDLGQTAATFSTVSNRVSSAAVKPASALVASARRTVLVAQSVKGFGGARV